MRTILAWTVVGAVMLANGPSTLTAPAAPDAPVMQGPAGDRPVYLVYYWRARPDRLADYAEYVRTVAEPIDEAARKAGVFEEVHTYTPAIRTGAEGADWTHVRVFRLKNFAAWDRFSEGLDAAAVTVFPDETVRRRTMGRSADMRDLVRQEIWRDFR